MASEVDDDAEKREDVQIYTMGDFQSSILAARGSTFDALGRFDVLLYMQTVSWGVRGRGVAGRYRNCVGHVFCQYVRS